MSDEHCFISYSTADALDFARKLANKLVGGTPNIPVWFDKDDLKAGRDWDIQIDDALKSCRMVLFVMTKDSTHDKSVCRQEWSRALSFKKPIIPLWVQNDINVPFRLADRQRIDFRGDFDRGLAQLRDYLAWLDSSEGVLQTYKDRLLDAERDLQRAKEEDKPRIQLDIEELTKQIEIQEKIVANPKAAQEQTQKNIEAGLERERQPEKPVASKTSTKFINPPPGLAPTYFQDRTLETHEAVKFLQDDSQRLMTIVGRGGVGKTAMVCRLLKGLEGGELPDGLGNMRVEGIVYLSESGSHRVNFVNIFYDLCKLLPSETAQELDAVYKNPQGSTESKMRALLEKFTGGRVVLLLDNFEPLVDTETFAIRDAELDEALRAFLNGTHTAVKIVLTTRVAPRALNLTQPGRQRVLTLDEGLESPYAENILREMDSDGRMGLKSAPVDLLSRARERTRGYPRALEALFAILASDRYTTLEELLAMPTPENVVEALVGEAFNRLDTNAQKVMQALAVYNRPVTPAAVDFLLAPHIPAMDSAPILQRLANMHFARKESGRFYLHPVDREFAFGLIAKEITAESQSRQRKPLKNSALSASLRLNALESNAFTQHDLLSRAADYFAQARKPRAEWKKLDDLAAQLAEFDLRSAAGDYDSAGNILADIDFDYLQLWGHYRLLIGYYEGLQGKITSSNLKKRSLNELGMAYRIIGNVQKCIQYYEKALEIAKEEKDHSYEGVLLGNLGVAYATLGDARKSIEFYEQALVIDREIGNRSGEGTSLGNLGNAYNELGDVYKAIEYQEQALVIDREIGNRSGEGNDLGNLAVTYANLGNTYKAIEYHEQALEVFREIGNRNGEGIVLGNLAECLADIGKFAEAEKFAIDGINIGVEISSINLGNFNNYYLAYTYLFASNLPSAKFTIEMVQDYDDPTNNHNASALHGIILLRDLTGFTESLTGGATRGENLSGLAIQAFTRAIAQADEILSKTPEYYSALDAKGLALCGLALTTSDSHLKGDCHLRAIETFKKAREIAPHAGVVKRVLRLFDELVKCDKENILKGVREVIEAKPLVE